MHTFKIGQTVYRQDPGNHEVSFQVMSDDDVKYHTDLQARGYRYTIVDGDELAFDLPAVAPSLPSAPRVHIGGDVCVACEG